MVDELLKCTNRYLKYSTEGKGRDYNVTKYMTRETEATAG